MAMISILKPPPVEADLSFAISKRRKAEGGFPGAERVLDQLFNGAARKRVGLNVEGRMPAREGATVWGWQRTGGRADIGRVRAQPERADCDGLCGDRVQC